MTSPTVSSKGKKSLFTVAFIITAAVFAFYLFSNHLYPVASVESDLITRESFDATLNASYHAAQSYQVPESDLKSDEFSKGLQRLTLQTLIDDLLIQQEVIKELGQQAVDATVAQKINSATTTAQIQQAVQTLYGLTLQEFEQMVLIPEARREILTEQLAPKHMTVDDWLTQQRAVVSVNIFLTGLAWENGQVVIKESILPAFPFATSTVSSTSASSSQ